MRTIHLSQYWDKYLGGFDLEETVTEINGDEQRILLRQTVKLNYTGREPILSKKVDQPYPWDEEPLIITHSVNQNCKDHLVQVVKANFEDDGPFILQTTVATNYGEEDRILSEQTIVPDCGHEEPFSPEPLSLEPKPMALSHLDANAQRHYQPAAGQKRKSSDEADLAETWVPYKFMGKFPNCDQVRRSIRSHLDAGNKVGEFCNDIGVCNRSLNTFLRQNGPRKGDESNTYTHAHDFFVRREISRQRMVEENKSKRVATDTRAPATQTATTATNTTAPATNTATPATASTTTTTTTTKPAEEPKPIDISTIYLEDEDDDNVPVYDSCDEVRRKIDTHLRKPGVTQAQFLRDIHAQLRSPDAPAKIQSNMLTAFRSKKGATAGNTSSVYYAAYVYFEKIRVAENGKKTKHRQEMERVWPRGVARDRPQDRVFCMAGSQPYMDQYGRIRT